MGKKGTPMTLKSPENGVETNGQNDPTGSVVIDELQAESQDKLAYYLRNSGMAGGSVRVQRKRKYDTEFAHLITLPPDQADPEQIAELYGGGRYRVILYDNTGSFFKGATFAIDEFRKGRLEEEREAEKSKPTGDDAALSKAIEKLGNNPPQEKKDNSEMLQFMMMMNQQAQASAERSDKMMLTMMTSMSQMFTAMKPAEPPKSDFQFKDVLPLVLEMVKNKDSLKDQLDALKSLQDLQADGREQPDMLERLIKVGGPIVGPLLAQVMGAKGPPMPPGMMTLPAPDGQPVGPVVKKPTEEGANISVSQPETSAAGSSPQPAAFKEPFGILWMDPQARLYLGAILKAARTQKDPAFYAEFIEDVLDESRWFDLIDNMKKENWYPTLFGDSPEFASQKQWLDQLRTELLRLNEEMNQPEETEVVQAEPEPKVEAKAKKGK